MLSGVSKHTVASYRETRYHSMRRVTIIEWIIEIQLDDNMMARTPGMMVGRRFKSSDFGLTLRSD